ncbi:DUF6286 domain-containing protein [uncultured Corynebacterium sp.]|uniref:DUF6286 domain-containing protein n=1 Tax=uncultured Corynebacterium sp. TaxID=159447 RepID=UPI0025DCC1BD|nr:DUF6286 domain-containing protein [uncultured Corynebacterium sp.]
MSDETRSPVPLAAPAARPVAYLVVVALAAIGVVAAHDLLVRLGALDRPELVAAAVDALDDRGWDQVAPVASVIAIILGVALLFVAFKPRRRTHLRISGEADMWARPIDVGRIASAAARRIPGVVDARTAVHRRSAVVTVEESSAGRGIRDANTGGTDESDHAAKKDEDAARLVERAVTEELAATFETPPAVTARIDAGGDDDRRRGGRRR